MPTIAATLRSKGFTPPGAVTSGAALAKATSAASPIGFTVEVQGLNAVTEHWYAIAQFTDTAAGAITDFTGHLLANLAREIVRPHWLSGDTFRSTTVADEGLQRGLGGWYIDAGPETQQAKFLEWGFLHTKSGAWISYPFMIPAAETIAPLFLDAIGQVVAIAAIEGAQLNGDPASAGKNALDSVRNRLYSLSKFQGDLQVFGIRTPTAFRSGVLNAAQLIGDVQSAVRGSIAKRITVRAAGRFTSGSLTASTNATVSGPSSQYQSGATRLYNRVAGRAVSGRFLQKL